MTTPLLRPWQASDLEDLCCRANDDRIASFMTDAFPHPYSSLDGLRFLTLAMSSPERFRAIVMADRAVGAIGLHPQGDILSRNAELGYWLSPEFHGKGIMTRAVGEMVAHGFATLPVHRIFARPFSNNPASMRVLEKAGFVLEARFQATIIKRGEVLDELIYGIRSTELFPLNS
jgi:[ribosomal protein S5]-alanine N-acetyltransferase